MDDQHIDGRSDAIYQVDRSGSRPALVLIGDWTIDRAASIDRMMQRALPVLRSGAVIDCSRVDRLDTTGAVLIRRYSESIKSDSVIILTNIQPHHRRLLEVITACPPPTQTAPDDLIWYQKPLADVGEATEHFFVSAGNILSFIGMILSRVISLLWHPGRLRMMPLIHQMDVVGLRALGIVGLINFIIGAVMVNQGAVQLARFGADIFVIDMLSVTHFRELGALMTAIIVSGRSGSAFTAQIGSMRLHEEVDAMHTMGMNPTDVLVLPRLLALVFVMPLLAFYADVVGMVGGMLTAWVQLNISPGNFVLYFRDIVDIDIHFLVGIIKAPFFAFVIAVSGCYHGLSVANSADSVGMHTTKSVVQSIFMVILLDSLFAVFFTAIGW